MANFTFKNIQITGISVAVPSTINVNIDNQGYDKSDIDKIIKIIGVQQFRVCDTDTTTADLGYKAADELLNNMKIDRDEIDLLVFVSQTPDYLFLPNTAPILQDRLGISKNCLSFDVPLGCSGFTYGLSVVGAYLQNPSFKKALLICGDTPSKTVNKQDKSTTFLFGDAASATILERKENTADMHFNCGSDGSGYKAIITPEGGFRTPFSADSLVLKDNGNDIKRRGCDIHLEGMDVFSFGINQAPKTVNELFDFANISNNDIDFAVFHQANMMMNEMIRKKLKLELEKTPYSLPLFGNTSSASIPLTIVTQLKNELILGKKKLLLCGFGVGLSWATCVLEIENTTILDLIEIK